MVLSGFCFEGSKSSLAGIGAHIFGGPVTWGFPYAGCGATWQFGCSRCNAVLYLVGWHVGWHTYAVRMDLVVRVTMLIVVAVSMGLPWVA